MQNKEIVSTTATTTASILSTLKPEQSINQSELIQKITCMVNIQKSFEQFLRSKNQDPIIQKTLEITVAQIKRLQTIQQGLPYLADENIYSNMKQMFALYAQHTELQKSAFPDDYEVISKLFSPYPLLVVDGFDISSVLAKHLKIEMEEELSPTTSNVKPLDLKYRRDNRYLAIMADIPESICLKLSKEFTATLKEYAFTITRDYSLQTKEAMQDIKSRQREENSDKKEGKKIKLNDNSYIYTMAGP